MFTNSEQTFEEDSSRIGLVTNVGFRNNLEQHVHYRAKKSVHSFVQTYKALEKYHPPYERQSSGDTKKKANGAGIAATKHPPVPIVTKGKLVATRTYILLTNPDSRGKKNLIYQEERDSFPGPFSKICTNALQSSTASSSQRRVAFSHSKKSKSSDLFCRLRLKWKKNARRFSPSSPRTLHQKEKKGKYLVQREDFTDNRGEKERE
jgi:hypothetical protein